MKLFQDSSWKWWQLKLIAWGGVLVGLALGIQFSQQLADWLGLLWASALIIWLYVVAVYFKK